jgi:hypothetical protein
MILQSYDATEETLQLWLRRRPEMVANLQLRHRVVRSIRCCPLRLSRGHEISSPFSLLALLPMSYLLLVVCFQASSVSSQTMPNQIAGPEGLRHSRYFFVLLE